MIVESPFTYTVWGRRDGQRTDREATMLSTVAVRVNEADRLPVACRVSLDAGGVDATEVVLLDHGGKLVRPMTSPDDHWTSVDYSRTVAATELDASLRRLVARTLANPVARTLANPAWWDPHGPRTTGRTRIEQERDVQWRHVTSTTREADASATIRKIVENVVIVGGVVHVACLPPCWKLRYRGARLEQGGPIVQVAGPRVVASLETWERDDAPVFRADRLGAAFAEASRRRDIDISLWKQPVPRGETAPPVQGTIEILKPGLMVQELPRLEVMEALQALAPHFMELEPETLSEAGEARSLLRQSETAWLPDPYRLDRLAESLSKAAREFREGRPAAPGMR